jgi:hypothetical protein
MKHRERKFACSHCHKRFASNQNLIAHIRSA